MPKKDLEKTIELPQGVSATLQGKELTIKGSKGELKRVYDHPAVQTTVEGATVVFRAPNANKREKAVVFSYEAHVKNDAQGVSEPYIYKLKVCSGHFPMNVSVSGNQIIIKNFLGEKVPRKVTIKQGVEVKVDGSEVIVKGIDKNVTGQVAADIEQITRRPGFDRRIFQDGLYIIEKAGKAI